MSNQLSMEKIAADLESKLSELPNFEEWEVALKAYDAYRTLKYQLTPGLDSDRLEEAARSKLVAWWANAGSKRARRFSRVAPDITDKDLLFQALILLVTHSEKAFPLVMFLNSITTNLRKLGVELEEMGRGEFVDRLGGRPFNNAYFREAVAAVAILAAYEIEDKEASSGPFGGRTF